MADHQEFLDLANEMILEEGRQVTLQTLNPAVSDPATPWKTVGQTFNALAVVMAVFVPVTGYTKLGDEIVDLEMFKNSQQVCLIGGGDGQTEMETAVAILDEGNQWKVDRVLKLRPAGLSILYAFGVSR
ncbi:MAG TPA: hypothetical protein VN039_10460 [Nitrospira sp.]|nr:hypothetical protein [Nitrospira sp.]